MVCDRDKINDYNDNQFIPLSRRHPMKKIVVAVLTIVGLASVITYVAKNLDN